MPLLVQNIGTTTAVLQGSQSWLAVSFEVCIGKTMQLNISNCLYVFEIKKRGKLFSLGFNPWFQYLSTNRRFCIFQAIPSRSLSLSV